ncbi:uncharacterized protein LOC144178302 isoform X2 [Haemaphysalis longicornis]
MLLLLLVVLQIGLGCATTNTTGNAANCTTPDGEPGGCILASQCSVLANHSRAQLRRYVCGYRGPLTKVCCSHQAPPGVALRGSSNGAPIAPAPEPLPNDYPSSLPSGCGLSSVSVSDNRVVNGRPAAVGAWPWMAAIYRKNEGRAEVGCGGALVSDKHVLTAAHCVSVGVRARLWSGEQRASPGADTGMGRDQMQLGVRAAPTDLQLAALRRGRQRHQGFLPGRLRRAAAAAAPAPLLRDRHRVVGKGLRHAGISGHLHARLFIPGLAAQRNGHKINTAAVPSFHLLVLIHSIGLENSYWPFKDIPALYSRHGIGCYI